MKQVETIYTCDRCGRRVDWSGKHYHTVEVDAESFVGIRAMYASNGEGCPKYDLCLECTLEIARQFIEKQEEAIMDRALDVEVFCPFCGGLIKKRDLQCPHCQEFLPLDAGR